jgi:dCTP diphosphatase
VDVRGIQRRLAEFARERDWSQFHSPKNLVMALAAEVGELIELFQWLTEDQSRVISDAATRRAIAEELADVTIYILRLADKLGIDLDAAVRAKISANALKYPIKASRGNATKYNRRGRSMPNVILQPAGSDEAQKHYHNTMQTQVPVEKVMRYLNGDDRGRFEASVIGRKGVHVWGVVPGKKMVNVGKWSRIEPRDICLFAGDKKLFAACLVLEKANSQGLALELWGVDENKRTWEYVYFLDRVISADIPYADLNRLVGYSETNNVQGFNVLKPQKCARFLAAHRTLIDRLC